MKLIALCHAATASMRSGGFPAVGEPAEGRLDPRGFARIATSPYLAARQTAAMLGGNAVPVEALRDIDHGRWTGLSFASVHAGAPAALADWLAQPWAGTPDGETFDAVCARVGGWMDAGELPEIVVTHPMVIRALLAVTVGIGAEAAMRIDVAPLSTVVLSRHRGWRLQQLGGRLD